MHPQGQSSSGASQPWPVSMDCAHISVAARTMTWRTSRTWPIIVTAVKSLVVPVMGARVRMDFWLHIALVVEPVDPPFEKKSSVLYTCLVMVGSRLRQAWGAVV